LLIGVIVWRVRATSGDDEYDGAHEFAENDYRMSGDLDGELATPPPGDICMLFCHVIF
jgi:hypothetical protein